MKRQIFSLALALVITPLLLGGCSKRYHNLPAFSAIPIYDAENQSVGRFKTTYLADQIHAYFRGQAAGPIAVTTFVNIDQLNSSSTFGRLVSEQLMSELALRGYNVLEIRQSHAMQMMHGEGEFRLSRDIATLRHEYDVSGIVVGTYAVSPVRVYLNARLIDPATSVLTSVGTVEMAKSREITRLLRSSSFPLTLERIPVKQLGYTAYPHPRYAPYFWPAPPAHGFMQEEHHEMHEKKDHSGQMKMEMEKQPQAAPQLPPSPRLEDTT